MVEITDRESLEAWLRTRPREDSVLIAARCALRVLPLVHYGLEEGETEERGLDKHRQKVRSDLVLPAFRLVSVATFAGTWPSHLELACDVVVVAEESMDGVRAGEFYGDVALKACSTAFNSASVTVNTSGSLAAAKAAADTALYAAHALSSAPAGAGGRASVVQVWRSVLVSMK